MEQEMDLSYYIRILKENWIAAALALILVFGLVAAYTFMTPKTYSTKSMILIPESDQTNFLLGSYTAPRNDLDTQKQVILSQQVIQEIYNKYGQENFSATASVIKDSTVLQISIEAGDPEVAMLVANEIADAYINYTTQTRLQDASKIELYIEDQIISTNKEVDDLNMKILQFKTNVNLSVQQQFDYQTLQRQLVSKIKIYDYLLNRLEEAKLITEGRSVNIKIVEYAALPSKPIKPNVELNLVVGLFLGVLAGAGLAFVMSQIKQEETQNKRFRH